MGNSFIFSSKTDFHIMAPTAVELYGDPNQALFFGGMGIVSALVFGNMGAAYGTAKSGVGICSVAVLKPELIIKSIIPVVMAGILGIYGLIISVIISGSLKAVPYDDNIQKPDSWAYNYALGYKQLASPLVLLVMPVYVPTDRRISLSLSSS